jgi:hypothetical protein
MHRVMASITALYESGAMDLVDQERWVRDRSVLHGMVVKRGALSLLYAIRPATMRVIATARICRGIPDVVGLLPLRPRCPAQYFDRCVMVTRTCSEYNRDGACVPALASCRHSTDSLH